MLAAMWPFTGKRIFGNRWWALAFAAFVCWEAADVAGGASDTSNQTDAATMNAIEGALGNS